MRDYLRQRGFSWILVLVVAVTLVAGLHPKQKNLVGEIQRPDLLPDVGDAFYRIRRQHHRPILLGAGIRQIRPALEELSRNIRSLENKLMRHEYREAQVADFSVKTLNSLTGEHGQTKNTLIDMAKQLAAVEERVMAILTLVATSDERQRGMISNISEGLDRLLLASSEPTLGRSPNDLPVPGFGLQSAATMERDVKSIVRKMDEMESNQNSRMRGVTTEVHQLSRTLGEQMEVVTAGQEHILSSIRTCVEEAASPVTNTVDSVSCQRLESEMGRRMEMMMGLQQSQGLILQDLKENTLAALGQQEAGLQGLLREIRQEGSVFNSSFSTILSGLEDLEEASRLNLGTLHSNLKTLMEENSGMIKQRIDGMESRITEDQENIMGALDDTASMTDNLQKTVDENYAQLSKEIGGLNKVEQVMINTADAVLDTKRSIEFGIQQIILELGEIVSQNGKNINSTLSDQINAISINILKNQTLALTNMTQRMEDEISQVWRQIGIMYQQVEQSISMLDTLQDTTDLHMNVSLMRVGNMDGTVGEINGKVADVEENLNYLLGRLSLVVSEFSHMKAGIGEELNRLRHMAQEITVSTGNEENLKYNINKKRHIIYDHNY